MNIFNDPVRSGRTYQLNDNEFALAGREFPYLVARHIAKAFIEADGEALLKDKKLLAEVKTEVVKIVAQKLAEEMGKKLELEIKK